MIDRELITVLYRTMILVAAMGLGITAQAQTLDEFLKSIQHAAMFSDYVGTYAWQSADNFMTSRIIHHVDNGKIQERVYRLDGQPNEFIREDNELHCLMPKEKKMVNLAPRPNQFPAILVGKGEHVSEYYRLNKISPDGRVAGVDCARYEIAPRILDRNIFRVCVDEQNHLMLKMQKFDNKGKLIEQASFTNIILGPVNPKELVSPYGNTDHWTRVDARPKPIDTRSQGWSFPMPLGFSMVMSYLQGQHADSVDHLVFSDGLSDFSLFLEKIQPDEGSWSAQSQSRMGHMNIYRASYQHHWVTAVGSLPESTLETMVKAVKFISPEK